MWFVPVAVIPANTCLLPARVNSYTVEEDAPVVSISRNSRRDGQFCNSTLQLRKRRFGKEEDTHHGNSILKAEAHSASAVAPRSIFSRASERNNRCLEVMTAIVHGLI
jgi:hypothetical protein